jgi:hypothetical protein
MSTLARILAVAVVAAAAAGGAGTVATGAQNHVAGLRCPSASVSTELVGAVTDVLHSRVYVDRRYVGSPPVDVSAGSRICTDDRGEAIFDLSRSGKATRCILLPSSRVQAYPNGTGSALTARFEAGTAWCVMRRDDGAFTTAGARVRTLRARTQSDSIVGVVIDETETTVKVLKGVALIAPRAPHPVVLHSGRELTVDRRGRAGPSKHLSLSVEERIAIARLRLAGT